MHLTFRVDFNPLKYKVLIFVLLPISHSLSLSLSVFQSFSERCPLQLSPNREKTTKKNFKNESNLELKLNTCVKGKYKSQNRYETYKQQQGITANIYSERGHVLGINKNNIIRLIEDIIIRCSFA